MQPSPPPPPLPRPPGDRSLSTSSASPPSTLHHPNPGLSIPPSLSSSPSSSPTSATAILPLLPQLLPLYLPDRDDFDSLTPTSPLPLLLSAFIGLFTHHREHYLHPLQIERHHRVLLPYPLLTRHAQPLCPDFSHELFEDPTMVLPILSAAAHIAVLTLQQHNLLHTRITPFIPLTARLLGHTPLTSLRAVRSHLWTKLVTFKANVVKVGAIKHLPLSLSFSCINCSTQRVHRLRDGRYSEPRDFCQCPPQFRGKLRVDRARMQAQDWQQVRIQEIVAGTEYNERTIAGGDGDDERKEQEGAIHPEGVRGGGGLIPRYFECELRGDLVDVCMPGDVVVVTGVIKPSQIESWGSRGDRRSSKKEWQLFLDVNAVNSLTRHAPLSHHLSWISFEEEDVRKLMRVLEDTKGRPFDHLVHSLCPAIYGHDIVKQGLLLTLFGGNADASSSPTSPSAITSASAPTRNRRWNSHVLVVGDPGLGKSQMLKAVNAVSPRGVLVTGNASSASGLTVTMIRENSLDSDFALEAGALVLGDEGTTCIDEFDKLHASQHSALLEAMEQQTISIAKAGMIISLPARTSIFAAANPVGGHYNRSKSVSENIQLSSPLLSRFDLVFVLVDDANETADEALSHHVMRLHAQLAQGDAPRKRRKGEGGGGRTGLHSGLPGDASSARLPPMPPSLLRLYIAYARRYVHPTFTDEAKSALYHFYLSLRHAPCDGSSIITTRQLESLIRLAEARAKADLRSVVEESDALCVIQLMRESIGQVVMDEDGTMDWRRGGAGGRSKEREFMRLIKVLTRKKREEGLTTFSRAELRAMGGDLGMSNVDKALQQLNEAGYLLQHQGDQFKFREID